MLDQHENPIGPVDIPLRLALASMASGDVEGALGWFRQAESDLPHRWEPRFYLGIDDLEQNRWDAATERLISAVRAAPAFGEPVLALGVSYWLAGQHNDATACFEKALNLDENLASASSNLGIAFSFKGMNHEAVRCFEHAAGKASKAAWAASNLGVAYAYRGQFQEAESCFRAAIQRDEGLGTPYRNMAALYRAKGMDLEANRCLNAALLAKACLEASLRGFVFALAIERNVRVPG